MRLLPVFVFVGMIMVGNAPQAFSQVADVEVVIGPHATVPTTDAKSQLDTPFAIEFDDQDAMIIVEYDGGRILRWHPGQDLVTLAGNAQPGYVDGPARDARFNKLHNLAILDDGSMVLSDHLNHAIRKFDPHKNIVSTIAGNGSIGPAVASVDAASATFNQPICVSLTPDRKAVLIADIGNRRIRKLDLSTGNITVVAGNGTKGFPENGSLATLASLLDPRGAIQNELGELFVIDRGGNRLYRVDADGLISTIAGDGKAGLRDGEALKSQMNGPKHLCFGPKGEVYIADDNNNAIRKYTPQSHQLSTIDLGLYKLNRPHGVCTHDGWLYIADSYHHRVLRIKL